MKPGRSVSGIVDLSGPDKDKGNRSFRHLFCILFINFILCGKFYPFYLIPCFSNDSCHHKPLTKLLFNERKGLTVPHSVFPRLKGEYELSGPEGHRTSGGDEGPH